MDVVYRPWPTSLAVEAEKAGIAVVGGLPMLVHQAARQVELQTGFPHAPTEHMYQAAMSTFDRLPDE
jgi:shikimate dehydrogenase